MATATPERHVRLCPTHGVEVAEQGTALICPKGGHAVSHFRVLDRLKRTFQDVPVDGDSNRGGITEVGKMRTGIDDGPRLPRTAVTNPGPAAGASPATDNGPKTETLNRAKFVDPAGAQLWIYLVRKRSVRAGVAYLVRWARCEPGKKNKAQSAPLCAEAFQEKARDAFDKARAQAKADGWSEAAITVRELKFLPLPKPAPAPKGRR